MKELYDIKDIENKFAKMLKTEDFHFLYIRSTPSTFLNFGAIQFLCICVISGLLISKNYSFDNIFDMGIFLICGISIILSSFTFTSYLGQHNKFLNQYQIVFFLTGALLPPVVYIVFQVPIFTVYSTIFIFCTVGFLFSMKHLALCEHWNEQFIQFNLEKDKLKKEKQDIINSILEDDKKILTLSKLEDKELEKIKKEILDTYEKNFKDELTIEKIIESKQNTIMNY